jgi:hypothetical protein
MSLYTIFLVLLVIVIAGLIIWAINKYLPIPSIFKTIIYVIVVAVVFFWILDVFGVIHVLKSTHI